jgi:hypothetical protein
MDPSLGTPSVSGDPDSAYPIDEVDGAPSHPKDVDLSLGTPTRCFAQDDTWVGGGLGFPTHVVRWCGRNEWGTQYPLSW